MKRLGYVFLVTALFAVGCGFLALGLTHDAVLSVVIALLALVAAGLALTQAAVKLAEYIKIVSVVLIALPLVVRAEELQFDLAGQAYTEDGTPAGPVNISFMLDTASGAVSFNYPSPRSPGCVQNSGVGGAAFTHIEAQLGGQSIWSANSSMGGYGISNINENCPVDRFVTFMGFGDTSPGVAWEFIPTQDTQASYLASGDSAQMFLGSQGFQVHGLLYTGIDQTRREYAVDFNRITVTSVPEPGTWALLLLGLGLLKIARLRRTQA